MGSAATTMTGGLVSTRLDIWTLYDNPLDAPGMFVLRRFECRPDGEYGPTDDMFASTEFEDLRDIMRDRGLYCIGRSQDDEPQIVECWL